MAIAATARNDRICEHIKRNLGMVENNSRELKQPTFKFRFGRTVSSFNAMALDDTPANKGPFPSVSRRSYFDRVLTVNSMVGI